MADDIELDLTYSDETRFGGILSGKLVRNLRERCVSVFRHWQRAEGSATIARSGELMAEALAGGLGHLYAGRGELREDALYPDPASIKPTALLVRRGGLEILRAEITPSLSAELASWLGAWARGEPAPSQGEARRLYEHLLAVAAFTEEPAGPELDEADAHFVGHATVSLGSSKRGRVLIDPFLLPRSDTFPENYQPIVAAQLSNLIAVCITHCHPDHYSLGSLLKLGADTRIVVPRVRRESILSVGMAARLAELGFRHVEELGWGEELAIPGGKIVAVPFYGEQATSGARLHPEVRNQGNAYFVELDSKKYLAVADSGRDSEGDAIELAETLRPKLGQLDVLFGGYRSFPLYPIEYLFSSVPQYLLFVPEGAWQRRQKIMYDEHELLDLAECWGARHLVPYACGGAPWYWQRGLGPVLDGNQPASRSDPPPEAVIEAARFRTGTSEDPNASPIAVAPLRPGDGLRLEPDSLRVLRQAPHAWPYAELETNGAASRAGTREAPKAEPCWLQFDVAASAEGSLEEQLWPVLRRLAPLVTEFKSLGRCSAFFFQCKPPGFRVRIELTHGAANASAEFRLELDRARAIGAIQGYVAAVYEPEWRVFGGHEAMAAVHRYFDADTALLVDRLALSRSSMPHGMLETELWLSLVADDLVIRCTKEKSECWDVYSRLMERHPANTDDAPSVLLPSQVAFESHGERELYESYRVANQAFAVELEALANVGKLTAGRRAIVANVVQFQFNRHLLTPEQQQSILRTLLATYHPTD